MYDDTKPAKRSTRSRWKIVAATVGAVAALLLLGYAALHLPPVRRLALRLAFGRLERSGIVARASGLDYNLATLSFHLSSLTLATPSTEAEPFFSARDVQVRLSSGILFGRGIVIDDVAIDEPRVSLVRTSAGTTNWPGSSGNANSSMPRIVIGRARLSNLGVRWQDPQSSADIAVSIELTSNGGESSGRIAATRPGRIAWKDRQTTVQAIEGRLSWNGSDIGLTALTVRLPEGTLTADGQIREMTGTPGLNVHLVADANLASLAPWFDAGRALRGRSHADVQLGGRFSEPDAMISLTANDVSMDGVPPAGIDAAAHVTSKAADLTKLRVQIAGGSISASGRTAFDGAGAIQGEWQGVDLRSVLREALHDSPDTSRVLPSARLSGTIDARWTAPELKQLQLTGTALAAGDEEGKPGSLPVDGAATFALRNLAWHLSTDDIGTAGARAKGSVSGTVDPRQLAHSTIGGSVHVGTGDARRLVDVLARSGLIATAPVSGEAAGDFTLSGTIDALSLDGPLSGTIKYAALPDAMLTAHASLMPGGARLRDIDVRLGGSSAQGELGWSRGSDALRGMLDASVAVTDLGGLSATDPVRVPLDGRLGVSASLLGTLAQPQATIAASSAALDVAGQHFDRSAVEVNADLKRARFVFDRVTLQSGTGRIEGRGDIDLTGKTYTAHLTATDIPVRPVAGLSDSDLPISARLSGAFDGEGSFTNLGGSGRIALADARWQDADLGNPAADIRLEGRNAVVSVDAPELALKGTGSIGVDPRGTLAVRGEWTPNDIAAIQQRLAVAPSTPMSGSAGLRFELNGTRDHLDELHGLLNLDALDVTVSGQAIKLVRPGQLEYDGRTARAGNIGLATGTSTLVIDGSIGDQAARGITASLDGMLADFAFVRDLVRPRASDAAPLPAPAGSIQLRLTAAGAIARPALTGTFQVADGRVPLTPEQGVTGIGISGKYDAGVLTVDRANAAFEGASLTATARVPSNVFIDRLPAFLRGRIVPADGLASLSAQLLSVTQAVAVPFVDPATLDQLGGRIDATVQLEADRVALERVRGAITLDRAELRLGGTELDQQTTTRVSIREGRVTVDAWEWGRGDNRLTVRGGATLGANSTLSLAATSVLDLRVLNILTPSTRVAGRADAEIRLGGTVRAPTLDGWVTVSNAEARIANPRVIVSDVTGTVTLAADTITVERAFAYLNGGESEIAGTLRHRWFTPLGGRLTMVTNSAALAIEGLRAEANVNVALEADPGRPVVSGTVTLVRSAFRERLSLTSGLLKALQAPSTSSIPAPPSALDRLRLDVRIVTESDLLVDNNYGKFTATADLRLVGTASRPSITGRTTLGEGGSIFFGTRRYRLQEGGSIDFANPNRIEPDLNLTATTNVQSSEIQLTITGTPSTLMTRLDAPNNPELSESDKVSLLLTGQKASDATTAGISSGGTELLGLLSGEFLNAAGQSVGLSTIRVESGSPDLRFDAGLVATETDPGTRLTVGKNIGSRFEVVFSQSLHQSGGLTWIVSYSPKTNLVMRVVNQDSGDRVYDFRHDLTFGRPANFKRPIERPRETVIRVQISGAGADENALRSLLKVKEGDRFSFFRWQDDRERIENFFHERERFEARVVTRRTPEPADATMINLSYDIRPGPRTTVQVQGFVLPASAVREVEEAWTSTVVDDLLQEEIVRIVRGALVDAGYVQASVTTRLQNAPDEKRLSILVETGTHADSKEVRFTGNKGEATKQLQSVLAEPRLQRAIWIEPDAARDALIAFYRANGYLKATVRLDPISRSGGTVIRPIQVDEGEPYRIQEIGVDGGPSLSAADIIAKAGLVKGEVITDSKMEGARVALDQGYRALGFNSVDVTLQSGTTSPRPEVNVFVHVDEGRQQRLRDVVTMGVEHTKPSLVSRALNLDIGEPVNLAAWNEARRRLYETGAFRSVDIEREVIEEPAGEAAAPAALPAEPVRALVNVQEWPRYRFRYGLELNDTAQSGDPSEVLPTFQEGGRTFSLGATTDFAARNLFGRAMTAGIAARYTLDFRAVRTYATLPTFLGRHIVTNLWVERSHEESGVSGNQPAFNTDATTFTFEQRIRPRRKVEVWYGYTIERNHTYELHTLPGNLPFDLDVTKANLTSGVILDRRNDVFDATGGWFHATNIEYAPDWLTPDVRLARLLTQQKYFRRTGKVVFASWAQLGLATAFEQTVLPGDRFFAGGGNSVRGYAEQAISPSDFLGTIVGGNALLVLNQEVRFPMFKYVRGVGFIDAGRAFETVSQMSLKDLAVGTGIGFRIDTPVVLLRVDMGVPLDSAYGSRKPRWFFSIGQMF